MVTFWYFRVLFGTFGYFMYFSVTFGNFGRSEDLGLKRARNGWNVWTWLEMAGFGLNISGFVLQITGFEVCTNLSKCRMNFSKFDWN